MLNSFPPPLISETQNIGTKKQNKCSLPSSNILIAALKSDSVWRWALFPSLRAAEVTEYETMVVLIKHE